MNESASIADNPNLATKVVRWIAAGIIDGRWKVGERLNEAHIAEELGVSRAPVREAMRTLGEQGMVTHLARIGSVVNEFTAKTVSDLYELRALIESWCASNAVPLLTQEEREILRRSLEPLEAAWIRKDYEAFYSHAWRMHEMLYEKTGNKLAFGEIRKLRGRLHSLPNVLHGLQEYADWVLDEHRRLVDAIEAGKSEEVGQIIGEVLHRAGSLVSGAYASRADGQGGSSDIDLNAPRRNGL